MEPSGGKLLNLLLYCVFLQVSGDFGDMDFGYCANQSSSFGRLIAGFHSGKRIAVRTSIRGQTTNIDVQPESDDTSPRTLFLRSRRQRFGPAYDQQALCEY